MRTPVLTNPAIRNQILSAQTPAEIGSCFPVLQELRPHLKDRDAFVAQIQRQNQEGYVLVYLRDFEEVGACMGFRIFETLPWGKILYIDDLITREKSRKNGFGRRLVDYAVEQARQAGCAQVHLDSGHHRFDAHRLYLNMGFILSCHHLALIL